MYELSTISDIGTFKCVFMHKWKKKKKYKIHGKKAEGKY